MGTPNGEASFGDANRCFSPVCSLLSIDRGEALLFLSSGEVCNRIERRSCLQESSLPSFCLPKSKPTKEITLSVLEEEGREMLFKETMKEKPRK